MNDLMTLFHKIESVFYLVRTSGLLVRLLFLILLASGCAKNIEGGSDGESHFLISCDTECEQGYSCICGVCTESCKDDERCSDLAPTAICVEFKASNGCSSNNKASDECSSNNDDVFGFCDVACKSSKECSVLGSGYACSVGFCRKGVEPASWDAGNTDIKEDFETLVDAGFESEWEVVESNTVEDLSAIWGFEDDDIWVAGQNKLLHYDGVSWEIAFNNVSFHSLWGAAPDDIWAVGIVYEEATDRQYGFFHYDGIGWQQYDFGDLVPPIDFTFVWGTSKDNVYAFPTKGGSWSMPFHWDGNSWTEHEVDVVYRGAERYDSGIMGTLAKAHGTSPDNIIVADLGYLYRYDGVRWIVFDSSDVANGCWSTAAWALSNGDFLVGKTGCGIFRYRDDVASIEFDVSDSYSDDSFVFFSSFWGNSDSDIFAVGYALSSKPRQTNSSEEPTATTSQIWRFDGQSWSVQNLKGLEVILSAIWGSPSGELWVVGDEGTILRRRRNG